MKRIEPIKFPDARKLTATEMNAIHFETGKHSDITPVSSAES